MRPPEARAYAVRVESALSGRGRPAQGRSRRAGASRVDPAPRDRARNEQRKNSRKAPQCHRDAPASCRARPGQPVAPTRLSISKSKRAAATRSCRRFSTIHPPQRPRRRSCSTRGIMRRPQSPSRIARPSRSAVRPEPEIEEIGAADYEAHPPEAAVRISKIMEPEPEPEIAPGARAAAPSLRRPRRAAPEARAGGAVVALRLSHRSRAPGGIRGAWLDQSDARLSDRPDARRRTEGTQGPRQDRSADRRRRRRGRRRPVRDGQRARRVRGRD